VLRDESGAILVSACAFLQACQSPLEAELEACRQGVGLALEWSNNPCVIEMDCSEAVKMISSEKLDRSAYSAIIQEIKHQMSATQVFEIHLISREQNIVSHTLANLGRTSGRTEALVTFWHFATTSVICQINQYIYCFAKKKSTKIQMSNRLSLDKSNESFASSILAYS
jgi:hypothetical protein